MCKNILCKSCGSKIGTLENNELLFHEIKAISKIETINSGLYCKCRSCNGWNLFIKVNDCYTQNIDHSKKSKEVFLKFDKL